jgi:ESCRT-II complex subunit VPS22
MRRGPGLGAASRQKAMTQKINTIQNDMEAVSILQMQQDLEKFQEKLTEFAVKHKNKINQNAIFRSQFQKMCRSIGVDPLASTKGLWGQSLTQMTDFYYELGIQAIEGCLLTKPKNGGIISIEDLITTIRAKRTNVLRIAPKSAQQQATQDRNNNDITGEDIKIALEKVSILGTTYKIHNIGGAEMVVSVPIEFQTDHLEILRLAKNSATPGGITVARIAETNGWSEARVQRAVNTLLQEGMCWVDAQVHQDDGSEPSLTNLKYWFPSIWLDALHQAGKVE